MNSTKRILIVATGICVIAVASVSAAAAVIQGQNGQGTESMLQQRDIFSAGQPSGDGLGAGTRRDAAGSLSGGGASDGSVSGSGGEETGGSAAGSGREGTVNGAVGTESGGEKTGGNAAGTGSGREGTVKGAAGAENVGEETGGNVAGATTGRSGENVSGSGGDPSGKTGKANGNGKAAGESVDRSAKSQTVDSSGHDKDRTGESEAGSSEKKNAKDAGGAGGPGESGRTSTKDTEADGRKQAGRVAYVGDSLLSGMDDYGLFKDEKGHRLLYKIGVSPYTFYNGSIMDEFLEVETDRLYMLLGMNALDGDPAERQLDSAIRFYKKILDAYTAKHPGTEIVILSLPPIRPNADQKKETVDLFNDKLHKMADEAGLSCLEPWEDFRDKDGWLRKKYSEPDGIHWNIEGCRRFRELMEGTVTDP